MEAGVYKKKFLFLIPYFRNNTYSIGNQLWDLVLIGMLKITKQIIFVNNMSKKTAKII